MTATKTTEKPTVHEAWSHVMGDVQGIAKKDRNEQQRFLFRGIDAVMNAVGPALRTHGVTVVPVNVAREMRDTQTTQGKSTRECTVLVTYRVTGPAGDSFEGMAPGESLDSGDKATAKAMSVAYRTFLLQALTIPTDEPDPDSQTYEHTQRPTVAAAPQPAAMAANTDWVGLAELIGDADSMRKLWKDAKAAGATETVLDAITLRAKALAEPELDGPLIGAKS